MTTGYTPMMHVLLGSGVLDRLLTTEHSRFLTSSDCVRNDETSDCNFGKPCHACECDACSQFRVDVQERSVDAIYLACSDPFYESEGGRSPYSRVEEALHALGAHGFYSRRIYVTHEVAVERLFTMARDPRDALDPEECEHTKYGRQDNGIFRRNGR